MTETCSLELVHYPYPSLLDFAKQVDEIDDQVSNLVDRMIEVMMEHGGIGIAAPQLGVSSRIFVAWAAPHLVPPGQAIQDGMTTDNPVVFINPRLSNVTGSKKKYEEGCLSLPGITVTVERQPCVTVTAMGLDGKEFSINAKPPLSLIIQHENDHLNGVLISHLSKCGRKQRSKIESELTKLREIYEAE